MTRTVVVMLPSQERFRMFTRRLFIASAAALAVPAIVRPASAAPGDWTAWDAQVTPPGFDLQTTNPWGLHPRYLPRQVTANPGLKPGDVHVDAVARYLYHIQDNGTAMRYGVAIGRDGLYAPGVYTIKRKSKWPRWTPTPAMIKREPGKYAEWAGGMPPGPSNALGSRALYLYRGNRDTYLRIHGTPAPRSIGTRASSGCVRMVMPHINYLYDQVDTGVTAYLYPTDGSPLA